MSDFGTEVRVGFMVGFRDRRQGGVSDPDHETRNSSILLKPDPIYKLNLDLEPNPDPEIRPRPQSQNQTLVMKPDPNRCPRPES